MDKEEKLNSPRSLKVCEKNGVLPEELYHIGYKEYLSIHPEISNLPDDIKRYRFNLLEQLRLKTIKMIKEKRKELIESNKKDIFNKIGDYRTSRKKWTENFFISDLGNPRGNMTFSDKMSSLIKKEKANINKIKQKQKQNIEYMIESQMKSELINYKNIEKDRKVKENREKKKKEIIDKGRYNRRIQEEKKIKRLNNIEEMMKKRIYKISIKHEKIDKKRNEMLEEKKKKRELLMQKRTEELIKVLNHRSQLDIFRQEQEKKLIEQRLSNEEKDKKVLERVKYLQRERKEKNIKKQEKSALIIKRNHEKKEEQLYQLVQRINKKHEENYKRLQEYYKEMELKNLKLKSINTKKRSNQEYLLKSVEEKRKKKIEDYYNDNLKKEQNVIICKIIKGQKVLNQKLHENEFLELVQDHKQKIELKKKKKLDELQSKMDELDQRITLYKKEEGHKSLKRLQESYVKQIEKEFVNKRIKRMKEYKFNLKEKEIEEKEKRLDFMKTQKLKFLNEKKRLNIELRNEKDALINRYNKLVKGKSKIDSEIVKQLYPEDEELYKKVRNMQTIYNLGNISKIVEEKDKDASTRIDNNLDKCVYKRKKEGEEIEKKVEIFRKRLREGITKDIETERFNEERRIRAYEEAVTIEDKKQIEQKNKMERSFFGKKIKDLNENIEKYVEDYRKKLMSEYGYC